MHPMSAHPAVSMGGTLVRASRFSLSALLPTIAPARWAVPLTLTGASGSGNLPHGEHTSSQTASRS